MVVSCYLPVFFAKVYPQFSSQYALISAFSIMIFGFASVMLGGQISEKYEKHNKMTNAYICIFGCLISLPCLSIATLFQNNFWMSVALSSFSILVSGSYFSPAISMMQNTVQ